MKVAVVGAGWAGCAAAVEATRLGHHVTLFEATRIAGGRARRVDVAHNGAKLQLDNGQHILIGAYSQTLKLMADLGMDEAKIFLRIPLAMQFPDGTGLKLPNWPAPLDAAAGILAARGWSWRDKASLLVAAALWQLRKFSCPPHTTVSRLCSQLTPKVMATLIEPLCVSALNTPAYRASGQVFLRVLRDALFTSSGGSNLLLPRVDLSTLMPEAALAWLVKNGADVRLGSRVQHIAQPAGNAPAGWRVSVAGEVAEPGQNPVDGNVDVDVDGHGGVGSRFDAVILACPAHIAAKLVQGSGLPSAACAAWTDTANSLTYEAITTVYAFSTAQQPAQLAQPMLALPSSSNSPAQFVFDRGQLGGPAGLLAFVISASTGNAATLASQVAAQARAQLAEHLAEPLAGPLAEKLPEKLPEHLPAHLPAHLPDRLAEQSSEQLSEQSSEQSSEQLLEQLPAQFSAPALTSLPTHPSTKTQTQPDLHGLQIVQTITEKRATFACIPGMARPAQRIAQGLLAVGDYVEGPYPATLEGAVRSGLQAATLLNK